MYRRGLFLREGLEGFDEVVEAVLVEEGTLSREGRFEGDEGVIDGGNDIVKGVRKSSSRRRCSGSLECTHGGLLIYTKILIWGRGSRSRSMLAEPARVHTQIG